MTVCDLPPSFENFLTTHNVMHLATLNENGLPHVASLMFAHDRSRLYWVSDPQSRHSRYLLNMPKVAATIAPDYSQFEKIKGLQITGKAQRVDDNIETEHALKHLSARYNFFNRFKTSTGDLSAHLEKTSVYRLACETMTLIDNAIAFGHKEFWAAKGDDYAK